MGGCFQMRPVDLIRKKRDGAELTRDELHFLISGYTRDEIPDYQMSAWLMSVLFRGMSRAEVATLTEAMLHSGLVLDLSSFPGRKVDKHSTGGVGDKTSLVIAPVVAAVSSMASEASSNRPRRGRKCSRQMRMTISPVV